MPTPTDKLTDEIARDLPRGLLDTDTTAGLLGVDARTLANWRGRGCGPAFIRMSGRCVRYRPRVIARYIAEREVRSTSDDGGAP